MGVGTDLRLGRRWRMANVTEIFLPVDMGQSGEGAVLFKCLFSTSGWLATCSKRSSQDNQDRFHLERRNWVKAWNACRCGQQRAGSKPGSPGSGLTWPVTPGGPLQLHGGDVLGPSVPAAELLVEGDSS